MQFSPIRIVHDASCTISILFNMILLVLILFKTPKKMMWTLFFPLWYPNNKFQKLFDCSNNVCLHRAIHSNSLSSCISSVTQLSSCFQLYFSRFQDNVHWKFWTECDNWSMSFAGQVNIITLALFLHFIGSKNLCFLVYSFMMHGHAHYTILLAFGFCYRWVASLCLLFKNFIADTT